MCAPPYDTVNIIIIICFQTNWQPMPELAKLSFYYLFFHSYKLLAI